MSDLAWYITLALVLALALVFLLVAVRSREPADAVKVQKASYGYRRGLFIGLVLLGVVVAFASLRNLPYTSASAAVPDQVINATGHQWYWDLDRETVVAGQPVEFRITSADVNHGFGIYDAENRLHAQVQAMPGYVNRLRFTFRQPGTYRVLCLEYCGLAHHDMTAQIEVKAP